MGRLPLIRTSKFPYHVGSRSNHRIWFNIPLEEVWKIAMRSFAIAYQKHPITLHSFVLMSNHYHMLITTPNEDVDKFMYEYNKNFSLELRTQSGLINYQRPEGRGFLRLNKYNREAKKYNRPTYQKKKKKHFEIFQRIKVQKKIFGSLK